MRLPKIIKYLEKSDLSVYQQLDYISSARILVSEEHMLARFDSIFETNPDLSFFQNFSSVRSNEKYYMYAPLTSCWVERSFSAMELILSVQRNMSVDTLKQMLSIYFSKKKLIY